MNKLEDQLKVSRQTEISDLSPPVDGWKAIRQQLPAPDPKTNGKSAGGPGTITYYWLLGAAVLLMVSISSLPSPEKENDEEPTSTELEYEGVYVGELEAGPVSNLKEEALDTVVRTRKLASAIKPVSISNEAVRKLKTVPDLKVVPDENAISEATAGPFSEQRRPDKQNESSAIEREATDVITERPLVEGSVEESNLVSPELSVPELGDLMQKKEERELAKPVSTLTPKLVVPSSEIASNVKLRSVSVPDHPGFRRNGKPKVRPEMQMHLSLMGGQDIFGERSSFYDRDLSLGGEGRLFVLPTGEPFDVEFRRIDPTAYRSQSVRIDLGLNRQTSSGFLFRLASGLYYYEEGRLDNDFTMVTGTEVREDVYSREIIVPLEAGLQFTFLKRHRFRPYLGVNLVTYLAYNGINRRTFFDAQTQTEGLIGQLSSQGVNFGEFDLSFSTGFQYKLTSRWSAGLSLNAHSGGLYLMAAPVGIEARYSLK